MRGRILWGVGIVATLIALAFAFVLLDRSTVVNGPDGSSFVTAATGLAALHDTLEREGWESSRIERPLDPSATAGLGTYLLSDAEFAQYQAVELETLTRFVESGGSVWILGVPPRALVDGLDLDVDWVGTRAGVVPVLDPLPNAAEVDGSRFGLFEPGHSGELVAGTEDRHLVVRFLRGNGSVVLVADSSLAHNATIARADNVDLFGDLFDGTVGFDEYRHGYGQVESTGLIAAAPGNWEGALLIGAIVLVVGLGAYGRRLGPPEPTVRRLGPDRSEYLDALAHRLRRSGPLPVEPLRLAVAHRLGVTGDADLAEAARSHGLDPSGDIDDPRTLDHLLAELSRRPR